jgi:hypothetical protein
VCVNAHDGASRSLLSIRAFVSERNANSSRCTAVTQSGVNCHRSWQGQPVILVLHFTAVTTKVGTRLWGALRLAPSFREFPWEIVLVCVFDLATDRELLTWLTAVMSLCFHLQSTCLCLCALQAERCSPNSGASSMRNRRWASASTRRQTAPPVLLSFSKQNWRCSCHIEEPPFFFVAVCGIFNISNELKGHGRPW